MEPARHPEFRMQQDAHLMPALNHGDMPVGANPYENYGDTPIHLLPAEHMGILCDLLPTQTFIKTHVHAVISS